MNESSLLFDGLLLMLTGMGTVFVFLSLLVFFTNLLPLVAKNDEKAPTNKRVAKRHPVKSSDDEVAAVSAAVYAYRKQNSRQ